MDLDLDIFNNVFITTTIDKKIANTFAYKNKGIVLTIFIPKNSKIIPLTLYSKFDNEFAILLPPNGNYKRKILTFNSNYFIYNQNRDIKESYDHFYLYEIYVSPILIIVSKKYHKFMINLYPFLTVSDDDDNPSIETKYIKRKMPFFKEIIRYTEQTSMKASYMFITNKQEYAFDIVRGRIKVRISKL